MSRRDIRGREPKKAKKDAKKVSQINILTTPPPVEVIRKTRKKKTEEE